MAEECEQYRPIGRPTGSYPEAGLEEINSHFLEADFWPGVGHLLNCLTPPRILGDNPGSVP